MDTPAIMHIPHNCAPSSAGPDPRAALGNLRATLDTATARRTDAWNDRSNVKSRFDFILAAGEQQAQMVKSLEERCSNAQQEVTQAETNLMAAVRNAAIWVKRTQAPEPPLSMPRSTNRVSYAKGSGFTASSSPVPSDPLAVQVHTIVHTDVLSGQTSKDTAQHQGVGKHAVSSTFINADGSMHLHVHTFNDRRVTQEPVSNQPAHLFVDPEAAREGVSDLVLKPVAEALARYMVRPNAQAECWAGDQLGKDLHRERNAREMARRYR
jgi:hypothetical protein